MQKRLLIFIVLLLFIPQVVHAHPADMYFHTHTVNISADGVQILWELVPGPMITHVVWHDADTNGDDLVSNAEAIAWVTPLLADFSAELDGTPAAWSPNAQTFLLSDLQFFGDKYLNKLSFYDVASGTLTPLPSKESFDDNTPTWSLDGEWIAFSRGEWTIDRASSGDQLWISRPDGSESRPLTDDIETTHGPAAWSPNGRYLLFRSYTTANFESPSQIVIYNLDTGEEIVVVEAGDSPSWFIP